MNYTFLKDHEEFLGFIKRLDEEKLRANCYGFLNKDAVSNRSELINILGGNYDKYYSESLLIEEGDLEFVEPPITDYGPFEVEPREYPAIAVWLFEDVFSRAGDDSITILNFISLPELEKNKEIRNSETEEEFLERIQSE